MLDQKIPTAPEKTAASEPVASLASPKKTEAVVKSVAPEASEPPTIYETVDFHPEVTRVAA